MKNQDQDFFQTKILGVEIKNKLDEDKKVFFTLHHIILLLFLANYGVFLQVQREFRRIRKQYSTSVFK